MASATFPNNDTALDLLLYVVVGREVTGLVEATLAANPGLAAMGTYPPAGTVITYTPPAPVAATPAAPVVRLF